MIVSVWFYLMDWPGRENGPILGESMDDDNVHFLPFVDFPGNQNFGTVDG